MISDIVDRLAAKQQLAVLIKKDILQKLRNK
jgi:hypothetical protein